MLSDLRHWQVEVDILPHRERGLEIQSDLRDDADSGLKHIEISVAREREDIAVGTHNLERRNRRREVPVPRAGANNLAVPVRGGAGTSRRCEHKEGQERNGTCQ